MALSGSIFSEGQPPEKKTPLIKLEDRGPLVPYPSPSYSPNQIALRNLKKYS